MCDGGKWLRRTALILAKNNYTPASFWLDMPLSNLGGWIKANNEIIAEEKQERDKARQEARQRVKIQKSLTIKSQYQKQKNYTVINV